MSIIQQPKTLIYKDFMSKVYREVALKCEALDPIISVIIVGLTVETEIKEKEMASAIAERTANFKMLLL